MSRAYLPRQQAEYRPVVQLCCQRSRKSCHPSRLRPLEPEMTSQIARGEGHTALEKRNNEAQDETVICWHSRWRINFMQVQVKIDGTEWLNAWSINLEPLPSPPWKGTGQKLSLLHKPEKGPSHPRDPTPPRPVGRFPIQLPRLIPISKRSGQEALSSICLALSSASSWQVLLNTCRRLASRSRLTNNVGAMLSSIPERLLWHVRPERTEAQEYRGLSTCPERASTACAQKGSFWSTGCNTEAWTGKTMLRSATGVFPRPSRYPPSRRTCTTCRSKHVAFGPTGPTVFFNTRRLLDLRRKSSNCVLLAGSAVRLYHVLQRLIIRLDGNEGTMILGQTADEVLIQRLHPASGSSWLQRDAECRIISVPTAGPGTGLG